MTRAYVRRKRFEAKLLAHEVVATLGAALGGTAPAPATPRAATAPTVTPDTLLKMMGQTP